MSERAGGLAAYVAVTAAYWAFMATDGALRMLVLLHFHTLGFSPFDLAQLFVLYEIAGMVTNLTAGWLAARFGLAMTLYAGLSLQVAALIALALLDPGWSIGLSVAYVMVVQGASGVAKDLAKMSSKSAVRYLAPEGGGLFRWVAVLTGSKNAIKGLGFLAGAVLLGALGFVPSVLVMAGALGAILVAVAVAMPVGLPQGRRSAKFTEVFSKSANINWLSFARVFLFGARDVWFVVGIPVYFYGVLAQGTSDRSAFFLVGGFMAAWVILYGLVQAAAPGFLGRTRPLKELTAAARGWALMLAAILAALTGAVAILGDTEPWVVVFGLLLFGAVFAINSSLHSYLILALTTEGRVTMDVGFYYMANAAGRLIGTVLSGLCYQSGGLGLTLGTACAMVVLSALSVARVRVDPA